MTSSTTSGGPLEAPPPCGAPAAAGSAPAKPGIISVAVLSDTHGHLYPEVKKHLAGVAHIIHAGDVGSPHVLAELRGLAPVTAVRGNCDFDAWAQTLPVQAELELGGVRLLVGHVPAETKARAAAIAQREGRPVFSVVIFGHSHASLVQRSGGILFLNPGSAGPRRFSHPRTLARLLIRPATSGEPATAGGTAVAAAGPVVQAEIFTVED